MSWYEPIENQAFQAWQWKDNDQVKILEVLIALSQEGVEWSLGADFGHNIILTLTNNRFDVFDGDWLLKRNGQWSVMTNPEFAGNFKERV